MKKRRVTLNLDEDIVEALEALESRSLSSAANTALRESVEGYAHRRELLAWLDELNAQHGAPTPQDYAAAAADLDELGFGGADTLVSRSGAA